MNERLKKLRICLNMTQKAFGNKIGVSKSTICKIEAGMHGVSNQMVVSVCRDFNVNEEWLRTGAGEMFIRTSILDELAEKYGLSVSDRAFVEKFVNADPETRRSLTYFFSL